MNTINSTYNDYEKEEAFKGMLIVRFMNDDITFPVNVDKRRKNKRIFQRELFIVSRASYPENCKFCVGRV